MSLPYWSLALSFSDLTTSFFFRPIFRRVDWCPFLDCWPSILFRPDDPIHLFPTSRLLWADRRPRLSFDDLILFPNMTTHSPLPFQIVLLGFLTRTPTPPYFHSTTSTLTVMSSSLIDLVPSFHGRDVRDEGGQHDPAEFIKTLFFALDGQTYTDEARKQTATRVIFRTHLPDKALLSYKTWRQKYEVTGNHWRPHFLLDLHECHVKRLTRPGSSQIWSMYI